MGLEDFEKELAASKKTRDDSRERKRKRDRSRSRERDRDRHSRHHHHHHDHHRSSRRPDDDVQNTRHESKRSRKEDDQHKRDYRDRQDRHHHHHHHRSRSRDRPSKSRPDDENELRNGDERSADQRPEAESENSDAHGQPQRDSWMQAPAPVEYVQRRRQSSPSRQHIGTADKEHKLKLHQNELNHILKDIDKEVPQNDVPDVEAHREVNYEFGDAGSQWRMKKLKGTYDEASRLGRKVEEVALERYESLQAFDEAREEEIEVGRMERYGDNYVGKVKPSGELYQERKLDNGIHREDSHQERDSNQDDGSSEDEFEAALGQGERFKEKEAPTTAVSLDLTALNKLKAQMMRAKLRNAPEAAQLEAEYNSALAANADATKKSGVVVLNRMEARMLAGGRTGEVKAVETKRGQERGHVEENEDMSIDDMVRQERRTKGFHITGKSMAERIAKDGKFTNDLDYLDDNAAKLARSVTKSEVNLRNTAIEDYQRTKRMLDSCPLCHHEDTDRPPLAPIVSLGTRTYLTLPTSPELSPLCTTIVPTTHRANLLECDDDEWEELRNFMKALARFYYAQKPPLAVVFYENAASEGRRQHAALNAVPMPVDAADGAPAFFREAFETTDEEWTQHRKLIDTLRNATERGMGKLAFRRSMVSELPYFHVWFSLDGGYGHVVEDQRRWPRGDLFARQIFGAILRVPPERIRKQGRWRGGDADMRDRVKAFGKRWAPFDWTAALVEQEG